MSYEKAYFKDANDEVFYVQFNPSEMTLAEKATWKTADEKKKQRPKIEYEKGDPTTLKMKLIFDASNKIDSDGDVDSQYIQKLRAFMSADKATSTGSGEDRETVYRPDYVSFHWGDFEFDGVLESLSAKYMMFSAKGNPVRAEVDVQMKERHRPTLTATSNCPVQLSTVDTMMQVNGTIGDRTSVTISAGVRVERVRSDDTLSSISLRAGIAMRWIAIANGIDDPMNLDCLEVLIPDSLELALVLEAQLIQRSDGDPADPIWMERLSGALTYEAVLGDAAIFESSLSLVGGELSGSLAVTLFDGGEGDDLESDEAIGEFFSELGESGPAPEFQDWEPGESDGAIKEYLGGDFGPPERAPAAEAGPLAESSTGEAATNENGQSDGAAGGFGEAGQTDTESDLATADWSEGGETEMIERESAEAGALAESSTGEAATNENGESEASASGFGEAGATDLDSEAAADGFGEAGETEMVERETAESGDLAESGSVEANEDGTDQSSDMATAEWAEQGDAEMVARDEAEGPAPASDFGEAPEAATAEFGDSEVTIESSESSGEAEMIAREESEAPDPVTDFGEAPEAATVEFGDSESTFDDSGDSSGTTSDDEQ